MKQKCFCGVVGQMTNCDGCKKAVCRSCSKLEIIRGNVYVKHDICLSKKTKEVKKHE